ncbi:MAG: hypothetical protein ACRDOL_19755 [Streptosporangiaceae bacterium]
MLISELNERTQQAFLEFAWRQWAQMGVSAIVVGFDRWAIDPEAMVLFTIAVARRDPRLFDEIVDWIARNRHLLSMQRLRNLTSRFPVDARLVDAVMVSAEESVPSHRLKSQVTGQLPEDVPVFTSDVLGFVGEPDPIFAEYGYIRPKVIRSGKSREPDIKIPANFAFQLRHLFGPSSRSEVMRILLTFRDGPLDAARVSDEVGFAKRNINDTLVSLAASRAVKARWSRNERHFVAYRDKWVALLEVGPSAEHIPSFVSWVHLLPAALEIIAWLDAEAESNDSEYLVSSRARELMEHVSHHLMMAGLDVSPERPAHGVAYLSTFADIVESLLAMIGAEQ